MKLITYEWDKDTKKFSTTEQELGYFISLTLSDGKEFDIKEFMGELRISVDGNLVIYPRASNNIAIDIK